MKLEEKIKKSGLLKSFIAEKLGLSPAHFSMMLNNKIDMPEQIRNKLNVILDCAIKAMA